jgi:two-component system LytT family response regulator
MGVFHAKLDPKKFLRIHRSTIVNIERIKDLQLLYPGEYIISLTSGMRLRSSRGYRHELQSLLDQTR